MIVFHLSGMEQTAHILIPAIDAAGTRLQAECNQITFSHYTKLFIRHISHSCRDSNFPQYLVYKGKHLNYIEILGIVVRELTREQDSEEVECR